jgi:cytochrome P450
MAQTAASMPPGPPLPRFVQTLGFMFAPPRFIDACRRRYGDVVTFRTLFDPQFVMVFDPELVKRVFQGPHEQLHAGEANAVLGPVLGDRSVLLLDGAEHLRQRRLMLPSFHGQRMRAYESVMREAADRAIDSWPVGREFRLMPSMQELTLEVIMSAVFGIEAGARREELKRRVRAMIEPVSRRWALILFALSGRRIGGGDMMERFEARRAALDEAIYEEIADRRRATDLEEREDVFSTLLLARDEDGNAMTDSELRDELVTLLVAGHETTATGVSWAFDLLLHYPRVLARARETFAGEDLSYIDAVVKESLRVRPVVPGIGRVVRGEPFELAGYTLPPGTEINPSIAVIHRRPDRYPKPSEFRPERFLGDGAPDTYTWIPFGGGPRRCLGASFAMFEMRVVIARVLERASLDAVSSRPDKVERRGITMVPREGVRVVQRTPALPAEAGVREPSRAAVLH